MKIEKINDTQIRCILTKEDLIRREIKISELAYGSDKAKELFREMMQQASFEFGFEAEDIPLMIEAIPLSTESIILVITKVEYPEELDTRFSRFSDAPDEEDASLSDDRSAAQPESADSVLDLFRKIQEKAKDAVLVEKQPDAPFIPLKDTVPVKPGTINITKLFRFRNMSEVIRLSHVLGRFHCENSVLYKEPKTGQFLMVFSKGANSPEDFNRICNILTEYAVQEKYTEGLEAHFREYYDTIIPEHAMEVLSEI